MRKRTDDGRASDAIEMRDLVASPISLALPAAVARRHDRDTQAARIAHVRFTIIFGLVFYNLYNFSDLLLAPDTVRFGVPLRLFCVTPVALVLRAAVPRMSASMREMLLLGAMACAYAVPTIVLAASRQPYAAYTTPELFLVLVFGGLTLQLRFPHMLALTVFAVTAACAALASRTALAPDLMLALVFQVVTGGAFVLYGCHRSEATRLQAYLDALRETLRSDSLEADKAMLVGLSSTDQLTGLANRRAFDAVLEATLDDLGCYPVSLVVIDVDHFKRFNDAHGHVEGDRCLSAVAGALVLQTSDAFTARYGGEEFAIILPRHGPVAALDAAEAARASVERLCLAHRGRKDGCNVVTISAGVATVATRGLVSPSELVGRADAALYAGKRLGRNRCAVAEAA